MRYYVRKSFFPHPQGNYEVVDMRTDLPVKRAGKRACENHKRKLNRVVADSRRKRTLNAANLFIAKLMKNPELTGVLGTNQPLSSKAEKLGKKLFS